jgi:hypothetical protein
MAIFEMTIGWITVWLACGLMGCLGGQLVGGWMVGWLDG